MFKQHPKGLIVLSLANMGERFGYYTMLAILTLYMQAKFGLTSAATGMIYSTFLAMVYFLPLFGGILADRVLGYGRTVLLGITVMFAGYLLLAVPTQANDTGKYMMFGALLLIALGTGFFKGNLQALVGSLYDQQAYKAKRDVAFSIFYMFINIGAFFAPAAANAINNTLLRQENFTYVASIPNDYVVLNDKVVDKAEFLATVDLSKAKTEKKEKEIIKKAKKRAGVIFPEDQAGALFRLKAAGLAQLTAAGLITDPGMALDKADYAMLSSRVKEDKARIDAITARIDTIRITDPALYGDPVHPENFARNFAEQYVTKSLNKAYNLAFGLACISLVISVLVFLGFKKTWKGVDKTHHQQLAEADKKGEKADVEILSPKQVKERIVALLLVFFVVIFFWMSFHQNGLCMTFFARDYTVSEITPTKNIVFSLLGLLPLIAVVYGIYLSTIGLFGGERNRKAGIGVVLLGLAGLAVYYLASVARAEGMIKITPQIFQQFNPLFIVILTPLSVWFFTWMANRNKELSAPRKIGIGMVIAALGFVVLLLASMGLDAPSELEGISDQLVSADWLIGTYFILTIAELFLSPMGLAFVSKVSPPQYKGLMQGGWLAATATGNLLVGVMGLFWDQLPLAMFWGVLVICCILSATFIFSIMRRLEAATN